MRKCILSLLVAVLLVAALIPTAFAVNGVTYTVERIDKSLELRAGSSVARVTSYYDLVQVTLADKDVQKEINDTLRAEMDAFFANADKARQSYLDTDEKIEHAAGLQDNGKHPYICLEGNKSVFVNNDYISIHNESEWYYGGVFNKNHTCLTFDADTGALVTLPQYMDMGDAYVKRFVREHIEARKYPDSFYSRYLDETDPADYEYYIDPEGALHLAFDTYQIAPGAGGDPDILADWPKAEQANFFTDVEPGSWYANAVNWAKNSDPQITDGTTETTFSPDATCTRGQVVTFLWRAMGCPEPENTTNPFRDVNVNDYYGKAVLWAVGKGVTDGMTATTFEPDTTVTRAQVVTFLFRNGGADKPEGKNPFTDVASNAYYADAVLWAVSRQITDGTTDTTFSPDNGCTRAQIVTFLYRLAVS